MRGRRGFFSSFQYVTLIGGQLLAVLVIVIIEALMTSEQITEWGWRIPFAIGAVAAVVSIFLRRTLTETQNAETRNSKEAGSLSALFRNHTPAFLTVLGYTAGGSLIFTPSPRTCRNISSIRSTCR